METAVDGRSLALITVVDNAGVTRVKTVPHRRLKRVSEVGVGLSDVFAVMAVDDGITSSPGYETPSGDMRLIPDLDAVVELHDSKLLWAPANMCDQELQPRPNCGRTLLARAVEAAREMGLAAKFAFESEFSLFHSDGNEPAHRGPGYSTVAFPKAEPFSVDFVDALEAQGIRVQQFHPEYSDGQFEVSIAHLDPVAAADAVVLLRLTAHRIAQKHGFRVSFSPRPHPDIDVGNGCHVHFSLWRGDENLFTGGPEAVTPDGAAAIAGILSHLKGLQAVLTPSVPSYERITPHHWAGAYTCWGHENREAAVRRIQGTVTTRPAGSNIEVKTVDATANPYLALTVLLHAALDGIRRGLTPPPPVSVDPDSIDPAERERLRIERLPSSLQAAVEEMDRDGLVRSVFGDQQYDAFVAVRRYEWERFSGLDRAEQIEAHRWRY